MATFEFLTTEWIAAARAARDQHVAGDLPFALSMNLVVTAVPFGEGRLEAHVVGENGVIDIDLGLVEGPDVSVALEYPTARAVLVDGDGEAAMAAFMAGKVRVEGDMTKLLAFQSRAMTADERSLQDEIRALTAP